MMILRTLLMCALLTAIYSQDVAHSEVTGELREQMRMELDEIVNQGLSDFTSTLSKLFTLLILSLHFFLSAFRSSSFQPASRKNSKELSATSYSTVGYVYQPIYVSASGVADTICETMSSVIGYAVNYCLIGKGYTYKFQLTTGSKCRHFRFPFQRIPLTCLLLPRKHHTDSCAGGVVQFFSDSYCSSFIGSNNLENFANRCAPTRNTNTAYAGLNAYQQIRCNTGGSPVVPEASVTGV